MAHRQATSFLAVVTPQSPGKNTKEVKPERKTEQEQEKEVESEPEEQLTLDAKLDHKYKNLLNPDLAIAEETLTKQTEQPEEEEEEIFDDFLFETLGRGHDPTTFVLSQVKKNMAMMKDTEEREKYEGSFQTHLQDTSIM